MQNATILMRGVKMSKPTFICRNGKEILGQSSSDMSHSHQSTLGVLIIFILSVFLVGSLFFLCRRKLFPLLKQKRSRKGSLKDEKLMLRRFQLEELERATKNFSKDCLLGSGAFGNVYKEPSKLKVPYQSRKFMLHRFKVLKNLEMWFLETEVKLLLKVKHRNLVSLMGFCEETRAEGGRVLVYEYVPNGSLLKYIMGKGGMNLTGRQRVNIAIGAAKGIAHLHDGIVPSIVHPDIKPSNILVGDGFETNVADFGLVISGPVGHHSHVSTQIKGTLGYLDPAYCSSFHLSPFSDVYSFGVILLQLVAAGPAVDTTKNQSNYHIINRARPSIERSNIEDILDAYLLSEPCNMEMMLKIGQLGLRCVVKNPKDHPIMTQVWRELEEALYSVNSFVGKHPSKGSQRSLFCQSIDQDYSQSLVGIDTSLRCLEANSVNIGVDQSTLRGIRTETEKKRQS